MAKKKTLTDVVFDVYRELYKKATPSADFDELWANAEINDDGQRVIHYMDYYLDKDEYNAIVDKYVKRFKRRGEAFTNGLKFEAYLGCGPTSHKKERSDNQEDEE